jgi:hypothetical protein
VSLRLLQAYSMVATRQERESPTTSTRKMPPTFSRPSAAAPLSGFSCAGRGPISRGIAMGGTNERTEPKCGGGAQNTRSRARIYKHLRSPGIDFKESVPPAYVAWQAGIRMTTLFLLGS